MATIGFVACSKSKIAHAAPAAALYCSSLFRKSLLTALRDTDTVYILSALHGVLRLEELTIPYDKTLKNMPAPERLMWGLKVREQLNHIIKPRDRVNLYCGSEYIKPIARSLLDLGAKVTNPLESLSLGQRLSKLQHWNGENELRGQLKVANRLLRRLWLAQCGGKKFGDLGRTNQWPRRGLYIIVENGSAARLEMPRICRVGTHAVSAGSKTSLWNRLSTHRGTLQGLGSHRSSIFRLHVGRAIVAARQGEAWPESWGQGQNASPETRAGEAGLEQAVSQYISNLSVIWLDIPDEPGPDSDRAYLERNLIALLARCGFLFPSSIGKWLGEWSPEWRIAATGLWNLNHVLAEVDPEFTSVLEHYVHMTLGLKPQVSDRKAPHGWRNRSRATMERQLSFLGVKS